MTGRFTAWFPMTLLIALAALTFWLDRQMQPAERANDGKMRHDPDLIVDKLHSTRIGPDGTIRYRLSADRMAHYPDDDTTELDAPRLVSYGSSKSTVTVTSRKATLSKDGENAYLQEDVRLVRSAYGNKGELKVETSYLHVIPEKNISKTDAPVRITDAHTLITAVGSEFDSEARVLKLLSSVRSSFEKPHR